jgi:hypothetical protein
MEGRVELESMWCEEVRKVVSGEKAAKVELLYDAAEDVYPATRGFPSTSATMA